MVSHALFLEDVFQEQTRCLILYPNFLPTPLYPSWNITPIQMSRRVTHLCIKTSLWDNYVPQVFPLCSVRSLTGQWEDLRLPTVQCSITYCTVGGPAFPGLPTVQRSITYWKVGGPDNKVRIVSLLQTPLAKQMCLE